MGHKVVIVDAHEDLLETLADLLGSSGWGPVTTATSASEGFAAIERIRPDVAIVDLSVSGGEGMHLLHRVRGLRASPPVVVLSERSAPEAAVASVRAGARAFVPKSARAQDVIDAAEAVSTGGGWMPKDLLGDVLSRLLEPQAPTEWQVLVATLTPREREVLDLMIAGYDRPSISRRLGISINTVRTHTKNILAKLGVHSSLEAVSVALRAGLRPVGVI
ncbi:MAG TPA: response regulator transcription factor [Acidimicrobiales bacterium]|jgi:two-component system NarL family response regulator|nr:response regulator transcription factor [Acidimicrobiales bacterium]